MKIKNILTITIIISILVVLLLLGMTAPRFLGGSKNMRRRDAAIPKMAPIESAINTYKLNTGKLPSKLEDLCICPAELENLWRGPYLKLNHLNDPWDRQYIYNIYTGGYTLISFGNDGLPGGEDNNADIYNGYRR
ncbi:MAG: type II secretion system protein GspG [Sedimentisphaerales bacterium]|nr:type II secretion system protein GspG [Sedimentisphaerales bacterium]